MLLGVRCLGWRLWWGLLCSILLASGSIETSRGPGSPRTGPYGSRGAQERRTARPRTGPGECRRDPGGPRSCPGSPRRAHEVATSLHTIWKTIGRLFQPIVCFATRCQDVQPPNQILSALLMRLWEQSATTGPLRILLGPVGIQMEVARSQNPSRLLVSLCAQTATRGPPRICFWACVV